MFSARASQNKKRNKQIINAINFLWLHQTELCMCSVVTAEFRQMLEVSEKKKASVHVGKKKFTESQLLMNI